VLLASQLQRVAMSQSSVRRRPGASASKPDSKSSNAQYDKLQKTNNRSGPAALWGIIFTVVALFFGSLFLLVWITESLPTVQPNTAPPGVFSEARAWDLLYNLSHLTGPRKLSLFFVH
jgi:hypothetical protein